MFRRSIVVAGLWGLLFSAAGGASAQYYVTDLGVLAGGNQSYAMAVNDSGVVAGASWTGTKLASARATIYSNGAWVNIGSAVNTAGGTFATGINDSGQVSLWSRSNSTAVEDSYIYQNGTYTNIGAQPGACNGLPNQSGCDTSYFATGSYTFAGAINSSGQIAGVYSATNGNEGAFIWNGSSTTAVTTPGTDNGSNGSTYFSSINNNGVAVGDWQEGNAPPGIGFYYSGGTTHNINGGTSPEFIAGNDVVGNNDFTGDAFLYTLGATSATNIGTLGGDEGSTAYGVNSSGTTVGVSWSSSGTDRAFVYSGGTMTDLNTLVMGANPFSNLQEAIGISGNGQYIVGNGIVASTGETEGFLLTAAIPGDANGDGQVDVNDLTIVLSHFGQTGQTWADGAFTGDGTVDVNDLTIVLAHFGDVGAGAGGLSAVPEPGGLVLLAAGVAALLAAQRKRR
jgi:probable HAF family extracellular repeat protein